MQKSTSAPASSRRSPADWLRAIAPAVVVAAVVLGPGTITVASRVGCRHGYTIGWLVLTATILMTMMTVTALIVGVAGPKTPGSRLRERFGKPLTILVGGVLFLIVALFQSSNNRALLLATEYFWPASNSSPSISIALLAGFNAVVILFFWKARNVYRGIESAMLVMVGLMIGCFAINAFAGGVEPLAAIRGIVPTGASVEAVFSQLRGDVRALVATTFSVAGAFYQCYLVRERRWEPSEIGVRAVDSAVGIGTLGMLTLLIMWTAAAALHGKIEPAEVIDIASLADSLRPTFGATATLVFAAGILAGAVSSFIGNALIGGTIFSDCLGLGSKASQRYPRWLTMFALLVGGVIASSSVLFTDSNVNFIIVAQGLTTLGLPVMSLALLWLLVDTKRAPRWLVVGTMLGVVVTFALAVATMLNLWESFTAVK